VVEKFLAFGKLEDSGGPEGQVSGATVTETGKLESVGVVSGHKPLKKLERETGSEPATDGLGSPTGAVSPPMAAEVRLPKPYETQVFDLNIFIDTEQLGTDYKLSHEYNWLTF
jgi:hypothetical protein